MNDPTALHCPKCGQQQVSDEIRYCSRCGFLLTGVAEVVANDGLTMTKATSPRKRGLKQGLFILLLSVLIVPIIVLLSISVHAPPFAAILAAILLVAGGFLRMAYALLFESAEPGGVGSGIVGDHPKFLKRSVERPKLAVPVNEPAAAYTAPETGSWRDTNELANPPSVTDSTTRLLSNETGDQ